ncbi:MAG: Septum formation initiator [Gemmatimonadetes bacterium]|nr:Septum formation initiator [Gemmatimonadota bacterium]
MSRLRPLLVAAALLAALVFAIQGGEYSTLDLYRLRASRLHVQHDIDSLARVVDSLKRYKARVLTDPRVQERIAREEFGMVKGKKELLYRLSDSSATVPASPTPP